MLGMPRSASADVLEGSAINSVIDVLRPPRFFRPLVIFGLPSLLLDWGDMEAFPLERKAPSFDLEFFLVGRGAGAMGTIPGGAGGGSWFFIAEITPSSVSLDSER
jgi:hypothetical protein